jgi:hypothetical protein
MSARPVCDYGHYLIYIGTGDGCDDDAPACESWYCEECDVHYDLPNYSPMLLPRTPNDGGIDDGD